MPETEFHADYEFLKRAQRLTHAEILKIVRVATELGVSKIRLTGGEPLLDKKLPELVAGIAAMPAVDDLAMTTNAMLLAPVAQKLRDAGLHRVTISLDSIDPVIFKTMSGGRGDLEQVLAGIAAAEQAGLSPIKINVVVQRGVNDHAVLDVLRAFPGQWPHRAPDRVHGRRQSQRLAHGPGGAVARVARHNRSPLAAAPQSGKTTRARWHGAISTRTARARSVLFRR